MKSETHKQPKGQSYVIKPSFLGSALDSAGIDIDTYLVRRPSKILMDAFFWVPNENVTHERLYIRAGTVPFAQAEEARQFVRTIAVPQLIKWIDGILCLDRSSPIRGQPQEIRFSLPEKT